MGSVLTFTPADGDPLRMYITGDTLVHDDLRQVPERHPDLDVGLWHLGGTRIPGVLGLGVMVTMDAGQGADLVELVRPDRVVPVHHSDYGVFTSPLGDFLAECDRRGLDGIRPVPAGGTLPLPPP
jgi:L-ascorbate metabolism protein UlaG (beta-lactamase superfamily)